MFALVFLCVLPLATSFLIDVSTPIPPKAGTFITDEHYNLLMDFVMQERKSRQNLEKYVIQLNQRMTEMAKDVASTKPKVVVLEKANSNADLQEAFDGLKNSSEIMKQAYDKLLLEHSNLKSEVNVVTQRNNKLQIEVDSLKQLKTTVPVQTLANMNNFTLHLEKEIQSTNSMINKVLSDGNARKQDCIALMNVTNVLKTRLSDTQLYLDQKFRNIEMKQSLTETSDHEF
jgi:exonuclease VII large subunit